MPETITIRGRIATTSLRRGETVTVERTEQVDRLIAGGYVEQIGEPAPVEPEQVTAEGGLAEPRGEADQSDGQDAEPEAEAIARRKPTRKRPS